LISDVASWHFPENRSPPGDDVIIDQRDFRLSYHPAVHKIKEYPRWKYSSYQHLGMTKKLVSQLGEVIERIMWVLDR
jgi:hypothetical protein